jgi:Skp family chaperone for outer membrane proteins
LQKSKQTSFNAIAKSRASARQNLLKNVNPIIKRYMENNNIKLVLDKQVIILGDSTLEITDQIISTLNKELPSLKLN